MSRASSLILILVGRPRGVRLYPASAVRTAVRLLGLEDSEAFQYPEEQPYHYHNMTR